MRSRFLSRAIDGAEAIHEQRASCLRPSKGVERQQIDFRIPEDMPVIVVAGESTCSDGNALIGGIGGTVEMVDSETQRLLRGRVAFDLDIAGTPPIRPSRLVLLDDLAPTELSGDAELFRCDAARIGILRIASGHSNQPRNTHDLARTRLPMPGPLERTGNDWRNLGTVDL